MAVAEVLGGPGYQSSGGEGVVPLPCFVEGGPGRSRLEDGDDAVSGGPGVWGAGVARVEHHGWVGGRVFVVI